MRISIEVFEGVIDQANDDTKSLRHLSLTCTEFLPRARYHLFSSIDIQTMEQMETSRDFFDAHPWILPLVHKVTLSCPFRDDLLQERGSRTQAAHLLYIVPVHLLIHFPNLGVWSMRSFFKEDQLSFHRYALRFYQVYGTRIHHLQLSRIQFDGMSEFAGLVLAFTNIHTLTCSDIQFRTLTRRVTSEDIAPKIAVVTMTKPLSHWQSTRSLQISTLQVRFLLIRY